MSEHDRTIPRRRAIGTGPLTPRGRAEVAARRLARALAELDHEARIAVTNIVLAELARLRAGDPGLTA